MHSNGFQQKQTRQYFIDTLVYGILIQ